MNSLSNFVLRHLFSFADATTLCEMAACSREYKYEIEELCRRIMQDFRQSHNHMFADTIRHRGNLSYRKLLASFTRERIFMIGGGSMLAGADSYRRSDLLDVRSNTWVAMKPMSMRRGTFKTEAINFLGLIVVVSGDDHNAAGTLEAYNPFSKNWLMLPSMPKKLILMGAVAMGRALYVTGGLDKATGEYSDVVYCLDIDTQQWNERPGKLLLARYGHSAAAWDGKLWIAGGQHPEPTAGYTNSVEIFDPLTANWTSGPPMNSKRIWLHLTVIDDSLYAIGGDVNDCGSSLMPSIEIFCKTTQEWKHVTFFKSQRRVYSVSSVGSRIYLFGGRDANYSTIVDWDCYDTRTTRWDSDNELEESANSANQRDNKDDILATTLHANLSRVQKRMIPRQSFYGGQTVSYPSSDMRWQ